MLLTGIGHTGSQGKSPGQTGFGGMSKRMTKHTKRKKKTELPCHWVDEHGFDVVPKKPKETLPSDTAFMLKKAKAAIRPEA